MAGQVPAAVERGVARQEQDKRKPDSRSDALALRQPAEFAAAEEKQAVQAGAAPAGNARDIQLQTNVPTAAARPRGPLANQQANQQAGNQQQYAAAAGAAAGEIASASDAGDAGAAPAVASATPAPAPRRAPRRSPSLRRPKPMPRRPTRASGARTSNVARR